MTLDAYLKKRKEKTVSFAARTGIHRTEVWNYRTFRRMPRAEHIAAIEKATRGQVRAKDLISSKAA